MSGSLSVVSAAAEDTSPAPACIADVGSLCARVYDLLGVDWLAANADALIARPARILLVVLLAVVVRVLLHRGIRQLTARTATGAVPTVLRPWRNRVRAADPHGLDTIAERRTQRAEAIGSVLRSCASFVVFGVAVVLVLGELGVNLAPIIASAGVLGVALGFGAQNLVKDFIAGMGIILEDQYGVGDVVDLGEASGTVEAVGLRITRVRDAHGVVWYVRNGEVLRVGNKSQGFAQVVIDMPVAHDTDLDACRAVMQEVADQMHAEPEWAAVLLAQPESLGVEQITAHGVVMRVQVRATNADQWRVGRELRLRLSERFAAEGIRTPHLVLGAAAPEGGAVTSAERQATFGEVFAVPEFRPLFGSFLLSTIGDQLARVALTVLVYQRTDSPLLSAVTFAISYLPWLVGGPVLGTLADRFPRHRVLIASDVARGVLVAGMAVPGTPLPLLLVLLLLVSLFAPPFESARSALMADVLTGDRYAVATSLTNISAQVSQVIGFALAGTLVAALHPSWVLLLDAATFAVSALWLGAGLRRRPAPAGDGGPSSSVWRDTADGLRLIRRSARLLTIVVLVWVGVMFANAAEGIAAPLTDEVGGGATAVGLLLAVNPLGVTIGGLLLVRLVPPGRRDRLVPALVLLSLVPVGVAGLVVMWAPPGAVTFAVVLACMFVAGLGGAWTIPLNVTFVQAVPAAFRGRAIGVAVSGLYGVQGLGALGAGLAAEGLAASGVVALVGGLGVLAVLPPLLAWTRLEAAVRADGVAGSVVPGDDEAVSEPNRTLPSARAFYDEVGGSPTFHRLVSRFYAGVRTDPVLAPMYPQDDWEGAETRLRTFLEQYWGGPTTYAQQRGHPRLRMRHAPFAIGPTERDAWLRHMRDAVDSLELTPEQDATLWGYLEMAAHSMQNR